MEVVLWHFLKLLGCSRFFIQIPKQEGGTICFLGWLLVDPITTMEHIRYVILFLKKKKKKCQLSWFTLSYNYSWLWLLYPPIYVLQWLRSLDQRLRESIDYAICLDSVGAWDNELWIHVSKPPENAYIKQIFEVSLKVYHIWSWIVEGQTLRSFFSGFL